VVIVKRFLPGEHKNKVWERNMELTAEQDAKFKALCGEIKPGEYGRVVVAFTGEPMNFVQITGEKNYRFHSEKAAPTNGRAQDRANSGRY
jgi:hypothetical protein